MTSGTATPAATTTTATATTHRTSGAPKAHYHHGDLPNALRCAAADVIEERGLSGFSLREVARRAGVSHTAPAHHFGDARGLLTSLAEEGFMVLHDALAEIAATTDDPVERLQAMGVAYVQLGRSHPAHSEVMFRDDLIDDGDPELQGCGLLAYSVIEETVRAIIEHEGLDVELDDAVWLCWSAMQGLLVIEQRIDLISRLQRGTGVATDDLVRRFTALIVDGMRTRRR